MKGKFATMGYAGVMLLVGITAGAAWYLPGGAMERTDNAYLRSDITAVSARVGGAIRGVHVSANQTVAAGDLLLELDSLDYQLRLDTAHANVIQAEAALAVNARQRTLGSGDRQLLDAERQGLLARLGAALAQENLARHDLESTRVLAPHDGIVGDLVALAGARIAPGQRLLSLVGTGQPWVEANFKETQLSHLLVGQRAEVRLDALPGQLLHGRIESLAPAAGSEFALLPAENASGNYIRVVQRVSVRIALDESASDPVLLRPGLSAKVGVEMAAQP